MDAITDFLTGYWDMAQWYLIGAAAVSLVTWVALRRHGMAAVLLFLVAYVTLAAHFLNVRESLNLTPETALAILIASGLAVGVFLYFMVFVRTQ